MAGAWRAASAVGGDYYDVLALDEHHLTICRKIAKAFIVEWLWKAKAGARSLFRHTSSSMKSQEEVGTESQLDLKC